jgi:catechol 2,3-dioxygenase-like lactoylglutathione lyase family enzyme
MFPCILWAQSSMRGSRRPRGAAADRGQRPPKKRASPITIRRVVSDISSERIDESRDFYIGLLGFTVAMDMGSVVTLASPSNPTAQITLMRGDAYSQTVPQVTVEVADVDGIHAEAVRRGAEIVYPLTDEAWGVRRFFVRDPNGIVLNIMCHRGG